MEAKLGAAVIGAGLYGSVHARAYSQSDDAILRWVWSRDVERARRLTDRYGGRPTSDWNEIAADADVAVASVVTPDFSHTEPSLAMLRAGKHLLVEKPMATTTAECRAMIEAAQQAGVQIMVNFHNRWYPPLAEARRLAHSGELGAPIAAHLRLSDRIEVATRWLPWAGRSGPQWFLYPHIVDLANWLIGRRPLRVFASGHKGILSGLGVPCYDIVQAQVVYEDACATLESSWVLPDCWPNVNEFSVDLHCGAGKLTITGDRENLTVAGDRYSHPFTLAWTTEDLPIQDYARRLRRGEPSPVSGDEGALVTAVIEAVERSLVSGEAEVVRDT